ncbi:MAG: hypothetical protein AB9842_13940 [Bacteroidales bacterium]
MNIRRSTNILFVLVMAVLLLPFFQEQTLWVDLKPLAGYIPTIEKPKWDLKKWFKEEFQQQSQTFANYNMGFRPILIRINNQLDFNLFAIPHANEVAIGKENYLFENNYIKDYTGTVFIGEEAAEERLARLRLLQDLLKQKNIDLLVIYSPGKASFYPEYIPDRFLQVNKTISNYRYFSQRSKETGINHIDLNQYFLLMKDTVSWPIYPKCGIHWSVYGMALCADSIFRYIETTRSCVMPEFGWNGLDTPDTLRDTDNDIGEGMNLLFNIPTPRGAYPRFYFKDRPGMTKPDVLVIADSFYWTIYGNGLSQKMFNKSSFWFYFEQAYNNSISGVDVKTLDIRQEIESHQVVILMSAESNLYKFPFGFLERVYPLYFPQDATEQLLSFIKLIQWDKGWYQEVKTRAEQHGLPLEQAIEEEARITMFYKDSLQITEKDYQRIIFGISSDKNWLEQEKKKALEKNLSLEQVLRDDAKWLFYNQSKNYRRKYWPQPK